MAAPRKYPGELREWAIRLTVDARRDPATQTGALKRIGDRLGIDPETLRNWVTQAAIDEGHRPGSMTDDAARLAELEREGRELRRANAILGITSPTSRRSSTAPPADRRLHRPARARAPGRADRRILNQAGAKIARAPTTRTGAGQPRRGRSPTRRPPRRLSECTRMTTAGTECERCMPSCTGKGTRWPGARCSG